MNNVGLWYGLLSKYYGWNYSEIGEMTIQQILHALNNATHESADESGGNTIHFGTLEEMRFWRENR